MTHNYPAAILANFDGDVERAYQHLSKQYLALERQLAESMDSRFLEISRFESDSPVCMRKITEEQISSAVDMADCDVELVMRKWLYVDDAGELQPVTIGRQQRYAPAGAIEQPFRYAESAIVAGGRQVGSVTYTDH